MSGNTDVIQNSLYRNAPGAIASGAIDYATFASHFYKETAIIPKAIAAVQYEYPAAEIPPLFLPPNHPSTLPLSNESENLRRPVLDIFSGLPHNAIA